MPDIDREKLLKLYSEMKKERQHIYNSQAFQNSNRVITPLEVTTIFDYLTSKIDSGALDVTANKEEK